MIRSGEETVIAPKAAPLACDMAAMRLRAY
jgi:hypothetical protein